MRLTPAILAVALTMTAHAATAQQRWCAISNQGASNCGFATIDACRAEVAGTGGSCMPEAPVGHRQPGWSPGAPPTPEDEKLDELTKKLNRSQKPICRGC